VRAVDPAELVVHVRCGRDRGVAAIASRKRSHSGPPRSRGLNSSSADGLVADREGDRHIGFKPREPQERRYCPSVNGRRGVSASFEQGARGRAGEWETDSRAQTQMESGAGRDKYRVVGSSRRSTSAASTRACRSGARDQLQREPQVLTRADGKRRVAQRTYAFHAIDRLLRS